MCKATVSPYVKTLYVILGNSPAKATGAGMRTEREQFIKSSSSHSTESQFCLLSTMILSYLKVMSYGTFTLGNMMSSIITFHMLHTSKSKSF